MPVYYPRVMGRKKEKSQGGKPSGGQGQSPELWEQLSNETGAEYEAFKCYLFLHPRDRSFSEAYRVFSSNPDAKGSGSFGEYAKRFGWIERARAYDSHLDRIRQSSVEEAVKEEAKRQGTETERLRNRMNEMFARGYEKVLEWFDNQSYTDLGAKDVIAIMRLHMEAADKFGTVDPSGVDEETWTEEDDERFADREMDELDAAEEEAHALLDDARGEEEGLHGPPGGDA